MTHQGPAFWVGPAYRYHDPRWAFLPTSGAGAAKRGGRFNPIGVEALYLATSPAGALVEVSHGFTQRIAPMTLVTYDLDVDHLCDLTDPATRRSYGVSLADLGCAWESDLTSGRRPASHRLAERLRTIGRAGLIVPSFAVGAEPDHVNLVLWRWGAPPYDVTVYDPEGALPSDQSSWR